MPPLPALDSLEMANVGRSNSSTSNPSESTSNPHTTTYYKPISDPSLLPRKRSQISGACSNLVNSIVGAGIIGIPFALQQSGLVSGVILLLLVGYFTDKSLKMMVDLATCSPQLKGRGVWTYDDLMLLPFGPKGRAFVLCSMFVTAYGAMVAYLLIIKDTLPVVWGLVDDGDASVGGFVERELVMLLTSLTVVVPLSMQRDFSSLSFTSTISVAADLLLVVFVAVYAPIGESIANEGGLGNIIKNSIIDKGFFIGFGVLTVAMCCQHSAFIVASSLDNPTPKRWSIVTAVSLSVSVVCCLVLGVAGYLGFLDETSGDVLNNFEVDTASANFARALLAITMFFTYPMEAFVARHVLVQLLWKGDLDGYIFETIVDPDTGEERSTQRKAKRCRCLSRRHQVTLLIYLLTLMPALIVDDLGPVLSITGAIGGCCLAYIGPGLAYLGVFGEDFLRRLAESIASKNPGAVGEASEAPTQSGEAELPIDGDATAKLDDVRRSLFCPHKLFAENTHRGYKKPWWWYPLCIPFWIPVALEGSRGMNERLAALDEEFQHPISPVEGAVTTNEGNINTAQAPQSNGDSGTGSPLPLSEAQNSDSMPIVDASLPNYGFAIFFIVFGTIALVAGVASNLYVQIHGIFAIPA
uniref:Amino acid transporter transmembrane domain-containing protein n=1 Tax=Pseudo-nitzschia arenysensis TaxID=697910 RepID=A0A7R9ZUM1_9STRA|mmetsp:Transcript_858/g.1985  ORF Transcript_858/g.1985 Transcript_858/m.1985 type:complete len:639 (+) Transcript_858:204-2120(+)|eukprot:CAMPEP_0116129506 /NCGR_PEP_ID=MMETSP0329-20121206/7958_1 /TAXON_ID=697910 /ORGANISM="Pseudo-nitzschia arenysensis, Strain B593" /LENGTH=638 /DNA_ID=CAMNT_0003623773 /DNA_START=184 /DNA_END=2100 /DNA_ORIENTATION=+